MSRRRLSELAGGEAEAARLVSENRKLVIELDRQREYFDGQLVTMRVQLEQATARTRVLLSEVGFLKREGEAAREEAYDLRELLSPAAEREVQSARPGS